MPNLAVLHNLAAFEVLFRVPIATMIGSVDCNGLLPEEGGDPSVLIHAHAFWAAVAISRSQPEGQEGNACPEY